MREFETGATRDDDADKLDYEGFINPLVLERFAQYMHTHRKQADGKLRDSDNWQNGIPTDAYMKSMLRHVMALWKVHRGYADEAKIEESLCAIVFNAFGYLFNLLHEDDPDLNVWAFLDECAAFHERAIVDEDQRCHGNGRCGEPCCTCPPETELEVPSLHEHDGWTGVHQHGNMLVHEHHPAGGVTWSTWDADGGQVITLPTTPDPDDAQTVVDKLWAQRDDADRYDDDGHRGF